MRGFIVKTGQSTLSFSPVLMLFLYMGYSYTYTPSTSYSMSNVLDLGRKILNINHLQGF